VARGRIGVVIQEVTRDLATSFGLDRRAARWSTRSRRAARDKAASRRPTSSSSFDGKAVESSSDLPRWWVDAPGQRRTSKCGARARRRS
jgi:serine protease Do